MSDSTETVSNENASTENIVVKNTDEDLKKRVLEAIEMFRPSLQADGGDIEFVSIDEQMRLHVKLTGACGSCPMALMTLKQGAESYITDAVPEITEVVRDTEEGEDPDMFAGFM